MGCGKLGDYIVYGAIAAVAGALILRPERIKPNDISTIVQHAPSLDENLALYEAKYLPKALEEPVYKFLMVEDDGCGFSRAALPSNIRLANDFLKSDAIKPIRVKYCDEVEQVLASSLGVQFNGMPHYGFLTPDNEMLFTKSGCIFNDNIPDRWYRILKKEIVSTINQEKNK